MIKWENYTYGSGSQANLGHRLSLSVSYEGVERLPDGDPKWNVSVFGVALKNRSPSEEEARKRAETVARKWLMEAIDALDKAEEAS